jgi:quercetin dioxygenase-like cupin family protein
MANAEQAGAAYTVSNKETIAQVPGLQAVRFTMAPGESTPWHYHSVITDQFFCLAGPMEVQLHDPGEVVILACGEQYAVAPNRVHRVVNPGSGVVRYLLLQGIGQYDFIAAPGDAA